MVSAAWVKAVHGLCLCGSEREDPALTRRPPPAGRVTRLSTTDAVPFGTPAAGTGLAETAAVSSLRHAAAERTACQQGRPVKSAFLTGGSVTQSARTDAEDESDRPSFMSPSKHDYVPAAHAQRDTQSRKRRGRKLLPG